MQSFFESPPSFAFFAFFAVEIFPSFGSGWEPRLLIFTTAKYTKYAKESFLKGMQSFFESPPSFAFFAFFAVEIFPSFGSGWKPRLLIFTTAKYTKYAKESFLKGMQSFFESPPSFAFFAFFAVEIFPSFGSGWKPRLLIFTTAKYTKYAKESFLRDVRFIRWRFTRGLQWCGKRPKSQPAA